jgi:integrase
MATGIRRRHSRACRSRSGGRCNCNAGWEASVYSARDGRKIRKSFPTKSEAVSWRAQARAALEAGALRAPTKITVREAADEWLRGAEAGEVRNRSGQPYKPKTLRGYRQALVDRIYPEIGGMKLSAVTTADLQALVDRWQAEGLCEATIRNAIKPLQAIYRRARSRGGLPVNPTHDLELPAPRARETQIVPPERAAWLLELVPDGDRAIWATALYGGLRYGELQALRWDAVDLAEGRIEVRESWDAKAGRIAPKTRTSRRTVPIAAALRDHLLEHRLRAGEPDADAFVFARPDGRPFDAASVYRRADAAWRRAGLEAFRAEHGREPEPGEAIDPDAGALRFHQARHTFASFMIAAGVNAKAIASIMGHSSIKVTFDLYGHLFPGAEAEAAAMLDAFLAVERQHGEAAARAASVRNRGRTGAPAGAPRAEGG